MSDTQHQFTHSVSGGSGPQYILIPVQPTPPATPGGGCLQPLAGAAFLFVVLYLVQWIVLAPTPLSSVVERIDTAPNLQPSTSGLIDVFKPADPAASARRLIERIGAARSQDNLTTSLGALSAVTAGPLFDYERGYALRMHNLGQRERWQVIGLTLHAVRLNGPAPAICATTTWEVTTIGSDGVARPAERYTYHERYSLTNDLSALRATGLATLDAPCSG